MNVTVYSLPDCPKCEKLKDYMKKRGVDFEAKWFDTEAQTEFIMMNMFGNPPILRKGDRVESSEKIFEGDKLLEEYIEEVLRDG
jgi:glutaredoxin